MGMRRAIDRRDVNAVPQVCVRWTAEAVGQPSSKLVLINSTVVYSTNKERTRARETERYVRLRTDCDSRCSLRRMMRTEQHASAKRVCLLMRRRAGDAAALAQQREALAHALVPVAPWAASSQRSRLGISGAAVDVALAPALLPACATHTCELRRVVVQAVAATCP